jgi:hypothetical protein
MIKNKLKFSLLIMLALTVFVSGAMAVTPAITTGGVVETSDHTPTITFTPVGNNASYLCTLYVGNASGYETAAGTATVSNNTEGSITCDRSLSIGTYTYNVSMYNATESPTTTFSSNAALEVTTFASVISMLGNLVGIFTPIVNIVVAIIPILIALALAAFVIGLISALEQKCKGKM